MPKLNNIDIVPRARRGLSRDLIKKGAGQRQGWVLFTVDNEDLFIGGYNYEAVPVTPNYDIDFIDGDIVVDFVTGEPLISMTYFDDVDKDTLLR